MIAAPKAKRVPVLVRLAKVPSGAGILVESEHARRRMLRWAKLNRRAFVERTRFGKPMLWRVS